MYLIYRSAIVQHLLSLEIAEPYHDYSRKSLNILSISEDVQLLRDRPSFASQVYRSVFAKCARRNSKKRGVLIKLFLSKNTPSVVLFSIFSPFVYRLKNKTVLNFLMFIGAP